MQAECFIPSNKNEKPFRFPYFPALNKISTIELLASHKKKNYFLALNVSEKVFNFRNENSHTRTHLQWMVSCALCTCLQLVKYICCWYSANCMCRANSGALVLIVIVCSIKLQCNPIEIQHDYKMKNEKKKCQERNNEKKQTYVEITITIHIEIKWLLDYYRLKIKCIEKFHSM